MATDTAIEIRGLTKTYRARGGHRAAVDGLSLDVPCGGLHALLGRPGAGKTTIIRTIAGLARANRGTVKVLGRAVPQQLNRVKKSLGVVLEPSYFFDGFSGVRNLSLLARVSGVPKTAIADVLEQTGLTSRLGDRVRTYTPALKHRLALAAALAKDPEILIVDEPANDLDGPTTEALWDLLYSRAQTGRTVVVSSSSLPEVSRIADTITVLDQGRVMMSGTADEIMQAQNDLLEVGVAYAPQVAALLRQTGLEVTQASDDLLLIARPPDPAMITRYLAGKQLYVFHLRLRPSQYGEVLRGLAGPVQSDQPPLEPAEATGQVEPAGLPVRPPAADQPARPVAGRSFDEVDRSEVRP